MQESPKILSVNNNLRMNKNYNKIKSIESL